MHSSIHLFLNFLKKKKEEKKNTDKFHRIGFPGRIRIRIASPDANILHSADSCTCRRYKNPRFGSVTCLPAWLLGCEAVGLLGCYMLRTGMLHLVRVTYYLVGGGGSGGGSGVLLLLLYQTRLDQTNQSNRTEPN